MRDGLIPGSGFNPGAAGGFMLVPGVAGRVARRLEAASKELDSRGADVPEAPDAGLCTASVAAVLALFAESLGGIVEGLENAATAVAYNKQIYAKAEQASTVTITDRSCTIDDPQ
jgi:hypothetical protein